MNVECKEIQSMVEPFLAGKLNGPDTDRFINHVKTCKNCMDELEVYHVIYSVVDQLDKDDADDNSDYIKTLNEKLINAKKANNRKKDRFLWLLVFILTIIAGLAVWYFLL